MVPISNSSTSRKPECAVIPFPLRGRFRLDIRIEPEFHGAGWYILTPDRSHGWLHGNFNAAFHDAREIARGFGTVVQSSAGRFVP